LVDLGPRCNNGCRFCALSFGEQISANSSPQSLDDVENSAILAVVFVGGEPTLRDDLPEQIVHARDAGFRAIGLQTNGRRLAYARYTEDLVEAGLTHVEVTLLGDSPAAHDFHTRAEGSFVQTLRGIERSLRCSMEVVVTTVITRANYRNLVGIGNLLAKLGVRRWLLRFPELLPYKAEVSSLMDLPMTMVETNLAALKDAMAASDVAIRVSGLPPKEIDKLSFESLESNVGDLSDEHSGQSESEVGWLVGGVSPGDGSYLPGAV